MLRSNKLAKTGIVLILSHFLCLLFVAFVKPEYDGNDLPALIFWIYVSHVVAILGVVILLAQGIRWLIEQRRRR